jgi:hypothetical protein
MAIDCGPLTQSDFSKAEDYKIISDVNEALTRENDKLKKELRALNTQFQDLKYDRHIDKIQNVISNVFLGIIISTAVIALALYPLYSSIFRITATGFCYIERAVVMDVGVVYKLKRDLNWTQDPVLGINLSEQNALKQQADNIGCKLH